MERKARSIKYLKLLEIDEVKRRTQSAFGTYVPKTEQVSAEQAIGRVSAEDVHSSLDIPLRTISAMDGYAVISKDAEHASFSHPISLKLMGTIEPSHGMNLPKLRRGEAVHVMTGAPIPLYADSVVRVEEARIDQERVLIGKKIPRGDNIATKGDDVRAGEIVIPKARVLGAPDVALLMGIGARRIRVFHAPKIGVLSIGNELRKFDSKIPSKKECSTIVNNYSNLLCGFLESFGAIPVPLAIARDSLNEIKRKVSKGLEENDMVITIAGSSVGQKDLAIESVGSLEGSSIIFHGVRVVPIRPAGLAAVKGKPVAIIPGHAVSAALTFFTIVLPVINILAGLPPDSRKCTVRARLKQGLTNERAIKALYLVKLQISGDGLYEATSLGWGSNILSNLSDSNGFVSLEPHQTLNESEDVSIRLFGANELSRIS